MLKNGGDHSNSSDDEIIKVNNNVRHINTLSCTIIDFIFFIGFLSVISTNFISLFKHKK